MGILPYICEHKGKQTIYKTEHIGHFLSTQKVTDKWFYTYTHRQATQ